MERPTTATLLDIAPMCLLPDAMIYGVEIDSEDANQQKIFIITGNNENVSEAKQAIEKIRDDAERNDRQRETQPQPKFNTNADTTR